MARDIIKVGAGGEDRNLYTTGFILVDRSGGIRGYFDSVDKGFEDKISAAIKFLLR